MSRIDRPNLHVISGGKQDVSDREGPALLTRSQQKQAARTARYRRDPEFAARRRAIVAKSRFKRALAKIAQEGPITIEDILRRAATAEDYARMALLPRSSSSTSS